MLFEVDKYPNLVIRTDSLFGMPLFRYITTESPTFSQSQPDLIKRWKSISLLCFNMFYIRATLYTEVKLLSNQVIGICNGFVILNFK